MRVTVALGSVGSPGRSQLRLTALHPLPPAFGDILKDGLGMGAREWERWKGASAESARAARPLRLGKETPGEKSAADAPGSASKPRVARHSGGAGAQARQKCPSLLPHPTLSAQTPGG